MLDDLTGIADSTIPAFPTLPPGTPGYAIALVAVAVIVVAIVWFAAKFVRPREASSAPAPAASTPAAPPAAEADYRMARETIDRLEKKLEKAEGEQDAMRAAYDRQVERNHELEKQLLARDNTLASARDEIATLRANLSALQRPWSAPGSQYVVPPPPAPRQQPRRPPTHDVFDPDAPTDPLDTSPSRPGARP